MQDADTVTLSPSQNDAATKIIGFLHSGSEGKHREQMAAFNRGLKETGHKNVPIEFRWGGDMRGQPLVQLAKQLLEIQAVKVLVAAGGSACARAAKDALALVALNDRKPIVFTSVSDPIANGLVNNLDRPNGMTGTYGLTAELDVHRLELLHELNPAWKKVAVLTNHLNRPDGAAEWQALQAAAQNMGLLPLVELHAATEAMIAQQIRSIAADVKALLVTADPLFNNHRSAVIAEANALPIPAIYQWREFVEDDGLMSYGPNLNAAYRQAGIYAGNIFDNDNPRDLPIKISDKFELVINLKTAKMLRDRIGLRIPGSMLARAILIRDK